MHITGLDAKAPITRWGMSLVSYWQYTVEWHNTMEYRIVAWQVDKPDHTIGSAKLGACCNRITVEHLEDGGHDGVAQDVRFAIQAAVAKRMARTCHCTSIHYQPHRVAVPKAKG